jgi:hypothetical protein
MAASKKEAHAIGMSVRIALRKGATDFLDSVAREALMRLAANRKWSLPKTYKPIGTPEEKGLTLVEAVTAFLESPLVARTKNEGRSAQACMCGA